MISIKDIVKALVIEEGRIPYGVEYLLARTIDLLPEEKKTSITNQLDRESWLTSNFFAYGEAYIYSTGVYFRFEGPSHRTSASYFVDLNGNIGRKQRGDLLNTIEFSADRGYVNWATLKGNFSDRDFDGIEDALTNVETHTIKDYLIDSTVIANMPLYNLMIDDYDINILDLNSKTLEEYDYQIDEKFYSEIEWMIKYRELQSFVDRYGNGDFYDFFKHSIQSKKNFYRMLIPTENARLVIAIDIYSFKLTGGKMFALDFSEDTFAKINMDYVKIKADSSYNDFVIKGVKVVTGSQLMNYLDSLDIDYKFYLMSDIIKIELDTPIYDDNGVDYSEFVMECDITNTDAKKFIKFM